MISTFVSQTSWSENAKNTPKIEKSFHSNSCISIKRGSIYSTKGRNRKVPTFGGFLGSKTINPDPALKSWNSNRQNFFQSDNLDSDEFSNSFFSEDTAFSFFSKVSIFSFLNCCIIPKKMSLLIQSMEVRLTRIDIKCCWSWHASKNNLIFLQPYLFQVPFNESIDSFSLEADGSFLKILKIVFYIAIRALIDQTWQKL